MYVSSTRGANQPADIFADFAVLYRHHWESLAGRQPIGLVVTTGVVTDVVEITKHEGHGAEALQARAGPTCHTPTTAVIM